MLHLMSNKRLYFNAMKAHQPMSKVTSHENRNKMLIRTIKVCHRLSCVTKVETEIRKRRIQTIYGNGKVPGKWRKSLQNSDGMQIKFPFCLPVVCSWQLVGALALHEPLHQFLAKSFLQSLVSLQLLQCLL